jgi:hypothetical protein
MTCRRAAEPPTSKRCNATRPPLRCRGATAAAAGTPAITSSPPCARSSSGRSPTDQRQRRDPRRAAAAHAHRDGLPARRRTRLRRMDLDPDQGLVRLQEKGETLRWQPISLDLAVHLIDHADNRGAITPADQLLRYRDHHLHQGRRATGSVPPALVLVRERPRATDGCRSGVQGLGEPASEDFAGDADGGRGDQEGGDGR